MALLARGGTTLPSMTLASFSQLDNNTTSGAPGAAATPAPRIPILAQWQDNHGVAIDVELAWHGDLPSSLPRDSEQAICVVRFRTPETPVEFYEAHLLRHHLRAGDWSSAELERLMRTMAKPCYGKSAGDTVLLRRETGRMVIDVVFREAGAQAGDAVRDVRVVEILNAYNTGSSLRSNAHALLRGVASAQKACRKQIDAARNRLASAEKETAELQGKWNAESCKARQKLSDYHRRFALVLLSKMDKEKELHAKAEELRFAAINGALGARCNPPPPEIPLLQPAATPSAPSKRPREKAPPKAKAVGEPAAKRAKAKNAPKRGKAKTKASSAAAAAPAEDDGDFFGGAAGGGIEAAPLPSVQTSHLRQPGGSKRVTGGLFSGSSDEEAEPAGRTTGAAAAAPLASKTATPSMPAAAPSRPQRAEVVKDLFYDDVPAPVPRSIFVSPAADHVALPPSVFPVASAPATLAPATKPQTQAAPAMAAAATASTSTTPRGQPVAGGSQTKVHKCIADSLFNNSDSE
eukprot:TRINITY_DN9495_c0_g1_i2.p1 TRINITY_DN9495_c0_g1~~TRINITY_DN9495_c0_g1_i2.p1  ORF type:complete len:520 (+),score=123.03 TRINITY_DN9495_c0_g1_i2:101-1660(+)